MIELFFAVAGAGGIVVLSEVAWRNKLIKGEYARKCVHIAVGTYVAFWPYFLTKQSIQLIAVMSIVGLLVIKKYKLIKVIHDVKRWSAGDVLFPVTVLFAITYAHESWIYTVTLLLLSLADGMAAVIGQRYSRKKFVFKVLGSKKSLLGSFTYVVFAYIAIAIGYTQGGNFAMTTLPITSFVWIPLGSAFLEAVSPFGLDNIVVPLFVVLTFNSFVF